MSLKRDEILASMSLDKRFGSLFEGIKIKSPYGYYFNIFFLLRRSIFSLILVGVPEFSSIQIILCMYLQIITIIYIPQNKPFEVPLNNRREIFLEFMNFIILYHYIAFTDFGPPIETQYYIGYSMVANTVITIALNVILIIS